MLTQIQVKNFALADHVVIDLIGQLIVLTGETGAGKSILIDAIRFVTGERLDQIRFESPESGKSSEVEAVFELSQDLRAAHAPLSDFVGEDSLLIFRREVLPDGRSRAWINQKAVTISTLRDIGACLIDIHGQYDHQLLLNPAAQKELLDRFAGAFPEREKYLELYRTYQECKAQKEYLESLEKGREREVDLLKYQIQEIEKAELLEGEDAELKLEKIRLANSEKLFEASTDILKMMDEESSGVSDRFQDISKRLKHLVKWDASMADSVTNFEALQLGLEELIRKIRDYQSSLSFEPDRLNEIEARLDQIELVQKKYGPTLQEVLDFLKNAKSRYELLLNAEVDRKEAEFKMKQVLPRLQEASGVLHQKRVEASSLLKKKIDSELHDLQMPNSEFECRIAEGDFVSDGRDEIEFYIKINSGHEPSPLRKIVSAGEVSRVMLALKKVLAHVDSVPTLIFDEIDANIGGRLGAVTGQKLKEIAAERQVLLITHLPQIASFADQHIRVLKKTCGGKTRAIYETIEDQERIRELSQMMNGQEETRISKQFAAEMLERVKQRSR